jgi:ABC-type phosphate/phosphonate transport system substrate-binding protein
VTARITSLGMYDHPAQHSANDALWSAIAQNLRERGILDAADHLDRSRHVHAIWRDPNLLLAQACGYPVLVDPTLALRLVALPVYDAPGCSGATHTSILVARADDERRSLSAFRGARAAVNDPRSNTGMNLFRATIAQALAEQDIGQTAFFAEQVETGSHRASIVAVGTGSADIAAIDCVTYAAITRYEPALTASLRIVTTSPHSPTLPFVTAAANDDRTIAALTAALWQVMADPKLTEVRASLFLAGLASVDADTLAPIAALEAQAVRTGYANLR